MWATVPGYAGRYEASMDGRIRSIDMAITRARWGRAFWRGRELKTCRLKNGYKTVKLSAKSQSKTYYVHELVLLAHVGTRPHTAARGEIRHLDGDKSNNLLENLVYGTVHENVADRTRHKHERTK